MTARLRAARGAQGSVTAEVALALPGLLIVVFALILGVVLAGQQVRCRDAASAVARAIARGESAATVERLAESAMPSGANYQVDSIEGRVRVRVEWRLPSSVGPVARWAPAAQATSVAEVEQ